MVNAQKKTETGKIGNTITTSKLNGMLTSSSTSKKKQPCMQTAIGNLKSTIKLQYKQISAILVAIDQLSACREKIKSPVVIDAIDQTIKSTENLKSSTASVHSAFYEAEKAATRRSQQPGLCQPWRRTEPPSMD